MMAVANFRQIMSSTNTVMQLVNEEHNKVMHELKRGIEQNTEKINSILQHNATPDAQTQLPKKQFDASWITKRNRRRLQVEEDNSSSTVAPAANKGEGTKEMDADVVVPMAVSLREKKFVLYLSGFAPEATVDEIINLVKKNLNTEEAVDVTKLVPKGRNLCELTFVSFKVGISLHLKDLALRSSTWQRGIAFREFDHGQSTRNDFR